MRRFLNRLRKTLFSTFRKHFEALNATICWAVLCKLLTIEKFGVSAFTGKKITVWSTFVISKSKENVILTQRIRFRSYEDEINCKQVVQKLLSTILNVAFQNMAFQNVLVAFLSTCGVLFERKVLKRHIASKRHISIQQIQWKACESYFFVFSVSRR